MISRRQVVLALVASALAAPLASFAQQSPTRVPRVGWLVTGSPATYAVSLAAFRDGLQKLGYVEGRNITIVYRWAEGKVDQLPELANELVQQKVDIILAGGSSGVAAAKDATRLIPVVMAGVGDPVELGLVATLARPGGNITGFVATLPEMAAKRLEILRVIMPRVTHVAVIWNPTSSIAQKEWKVVHAAATTLQLTLTSYGARTDKELDNALAAVAKAPPGGMIILNDPFVFTYRKNIAQFAAQAKIPAVYGFKEFVAEGGMISYGANISDTYRRAANYVDRILKGANPAELPVQLPSKFELVVNLKAAKALGITIPQELLFRADEAIE